MNAGHLGCSRNGRLHQPLSRDLLRLSASDETSPGRWNLAELLTPSLPGSAPAHSAECEPQPSPRCTVEQSSDSGALGRWWLLWVLFYFYAYTYVDRLIVSILVPDMKATLGFSDTAMGLVLGPVPTVVFALWSFPAGWLSDRFPRRLVLLFGVLLFAMGTIGLGHSNSLLEVILARAVAAIGEATILPPSYSLIADAFPRKRVATAIAIFSMGGKIGA